MKINKITAVVLAVSLMFGSILLAQKEDKAKEMYEKAKRLVYEKNYEQAVNLYTKLMQEYAQSTYVDDSMYWLAYSQYLHSRNLDSIENKLKAKEKALQQLNNLIKSHDQSKWIDDAKHLRIEIAEDLVQKGLKNYQVFINSSLMGLEALEGFAGLEGLEGLVGLEGLEPLDTADVLDNLYVIKREKQGEEEDPEIQLKLVALNALMNMDEDKAFPILVKIVQEDESPKLREQAIFILSRSKKSEVVPLLLERATSDPETKVREQAVFWLGQRKSKESMDAMLKIYDSKTDIKIKEQVIHALAQHAKSSKDDRAWKKLLAIAKTDEDVKAQEQAIFWIGQTRGKSSPEILIDIYDSSVSLKAKKQVIHSLSQTKSKTAIQKLIEMAKGEKDLELKKTIIFWLGQSKDEAAIKYLFEILK